MPYLKKSVYNAVAATAEFYLNKPITGPLEIRNVSLRCNQVLSFSKIWAFLYNLSNIDEVKGLASLIVPELKTYPVPIFSGNIDWPDNWKLRVGCYATQTAVSKVFVIVEYERPVMRVLEVEKKLGWGE